MLKRHSLIDYSKQRATDVAVAAPTGKRHSTGSTQSIDAALFKVDQLLNQPLNEEDHQIKIDLFAPRLASRRSLFLAETSTLTSDLLEDTSSSSTSAEDEEEKKTSSWPEQDDSTPRPSTLEGAARISFRLKKRETLDDSQEQEKRLDQVENSKGRLVTSLEQMLDDSEDLDLPKPTRKPAKRSFSIGTPSKSSAPILTTRDARSLRRVQSGDRKSLRRAQSLKEAALQRDSALSLIRQMSSKTLSSRNLAVDGETTTATTTSKTAEARVDRRSLLKKTEGTNSSPSLELARVKREGSARGLGRSNLMMSRSSSVRHLGGTDGSENTSSTPLARMRREGSSRNLLAGLSQASEHSPLARVNRRDALGGRPNLMMAKSSSTRHIFGADATKANTPLARIQREGSSRNAPIDAAPKNFTQVVNDTEWARSSRNLLSGVRKASSSKDLKTVARDQQQQKDNSALARLRRDLMMTPTERSASSTPNKPNSSPNLLALAGGSLGSTKATTTNPRRERRRKKVDNPAMLVRSN